MHIVNNIKPILEVNLKSLKHNYLFGKNILGVQNNCAAVIKANAYGLGVRQIFQALREIGCNNFYFAYFDEAIALHDLYTGQENIYILAPHSNKEMEQSLKNNFIPVLNSFSEIKLFKSVSSILGTKPRCVIHFDTGMNRVELNSYDIIDQSNLEILYVMSHLACADDPNHPLNQKQLIKMNDITNRMPGLKVSFCNSAGLFLGPKYHFNQARVGCMLYGINPTPYQSNPIKTVVTIYAKVVAIRQLMHAESVSYGGDYIAKKGTRIATLAIGYADGYHRSLSCKGFCYFKNYRFPVLGRVTMDFIMVDITELPEQNLSELEYVEIMGANITVDEIAETAKTIGYEILTSLHNRYNRFYIS